MFDQATRGWLNKKFQKCFKFEYISTEINIKYNINKKLKESWYYVKFKWKCKKLYVRGFKW